MANIILSADSYKYSQFNQYPPNTTNVYSYISSRGGKYDKLLYMGLQMFLREYLAKPITKADIDEAESVITAHGLPFYREGWDYILETYNGKLPVLIKGLDEGTIVSPGTVMVTIENTDPKAWWLTSLLETALLRAIWYPTTVASNSYASRQVILQYLRNTGTPEDIGFKLHDFGQRGVSSRESAGIGGIAHLATGALGTDTTEALLYGYKYYDEPMAGFSIPAMEHSTVTSWGRKAEANAYLNMLKMYGGQGKLLACVSDSYDIYNAAENIWGKELKDEVIKSGSIVVVRPDSGNPSVVVPKVARLLEKGYGATTNSKGYKVLNNVRIIQGDGITTASIGQILFALTLDGYSADNIAFGQGGALLQAVTRDDAEFAMKCSAAKICGEWVDVYKDPITASNKASMAGRFSVINNKTVPYVESGQDQLKVRFKNGNLFNETTLSKIRALANQ